MKTQPKANKIAYHTPSLLELKQMVEQELQSVRLAPSKERAINNLQGAGILDKKGKLRKPYRNLCTVADRI